MRTRKATNRARALELLDRWDELERVPGQPLLRVAPGGGILMRWKLKRLLAARKKA